MKELVLLSKCPYDDEYQEKVKFRAPLVNPIIDLRRSYENILKIGEYIEIKCHNTPSDNNTILS